MQPHFLITLFEKSNILSLIPVINKLKFPKEVGQVFVLFCTLKAKILCNKIFTLAFSSLHFKRLDKNIFLYEPGGTSVQNMKY